MEVNDALKRELDEALRDDRADVVEAFCDRCESRPDHSSFDEHVLHLATSREARS